jgi:hypothetical protein
MGDVAIAWLIITLLMNVLSKAKVMNEAETSSH